MITKELIAQLKKYGLHLISIKDKKPNKPEFYNGSGDWSWKKDKDGNWITYSAIFLPSKKGLFMLFHE